VPHLTAEEIDEQMTERLISWVKSVKDRHFFAWMHLNQPHGPNRPSSAHDLFRKETQTLPSFEAISKYMQTNGVPGAKSLEEAAEQISLQREHYEKELVKHAEVVLEALYDASLHQVDSLVERVTEALRSEALLESTLLVISSDHGWQLVAVFNPDWITPDQGLEVPLILRGPGIPAGSTVEEHVSLVDLGPTLLDLAGLSAPPSFEGCSLVPLLHGGTLGRRLVMAQSKEELIAYLGAFKLVLPRAFLFSDEETALSSAHFFDLALDPSGLRGKSANADPQGAVLLRELRQWCQRPETAFRETSISEALKGFLREAGYLKDDKK
jgi:hypothetical protein